MNSNFNNLGRNHLSLGRPHDDKDEGTQTGASDVTANIFKYEEVAKAVSNYLKTFVNASIEDVVFGKPTEVSDEPVYVTDPEISKADDGYGCEGGCGEKAKDDYIENCLEIFGVTSFSSDGTAVYIYFGDDVSIRYNGIEQSASNFTMQFKNHVRVLMMGKSIEADIDLHFADMGTITSMMYTGSSFNAGQMYIQPKYEQSLAIPVAQQATQMSFDFVNTLTSDPIQVAMPAPTISDYFGDSINTVGISYDDNAGIGFLNKPLSETVIQSSARSAPTILGYAGYTPDQELSCGVCECEDCKPQSIPSALEVSKPDDTFAKYQWVMPAVPQSNIGYGVVNVNAVAIATN